MKPKQPGICGTVRCRRDALPNLRGCRIHATRRELVAELVRLTGIPAWPVYRSHRQKTFGKTCYVAQKEGVCGGAAVTPGGLCREHAIQNPIKASA